MRIILKVWSGNPDYNGGCEFAVVEITPEFAKLALRRITMLCEQKALDPAVDETYYWDSAPEFFSPWVNPAYETEDIKAACLKLHEELDGIGIDRHEMVVVGRDLFVPPSQIARVECAQMVVRVDGIAFTAIPKHRDFYVTTTEIPQSALERAAATV